MIKIHESNIPIEYILYENVRFFFICFFPKNITAVLSIYRFKYDALVRANLKYASTQLKLINYTNIKVSLVYQ